MPVIASLIREKITRRNFISWLARATALASLYPVVGCGGSSKKRQTGWKSVEHQKWTPSQRQPAVTVGGGTGSRLLLKNGLIADGGGRRAFYGDVLIKGEKIELVTPRQIVFGGETIDCTGKVIAPGFIDMHSHMD